MPQRTGSTAGTTDSFTVPIYPNAVALIGVSVIPSSATFVNYGVYTVQVQGLDGSSATNVINFIQGPATKSSWGTVNVDGATQQIAASLTSYDASQVYTPVFFWLVLGPKEVGPVTVPNVPFQTYGAQEFINAATFTSAVTTAQTVDFAAITTSEYIEILDALFYTSSTATGNAGIFDGTTRVDYDTTTAVATYFFNLGAKGSRSIFAQNKKINTKARFVIGAPGSSTTTLIVTYRVGLT